jgi:hypothetical protein
MKLKSIFLSYLPILAAACPIHAAAQADPTTEAKITAIMDKMTIDEKVGQMSLDLLADRRPQPRPKMAAYVGKLW